MITELFGKEQPFLDYLKTLKHTLSQIGGLKDFSLELVLRMCDLKVVSGNYIQLLIMIVTHT